jgi:hypothetical protein
MPAEMRSATVPIRRRSSLASAAVRLVLIRSPGRRKYRVNRSGSMPQISFAAKE